MNARRALACFFVVAVLAHATEIEREKFRLTLPAGWHEARNPQQVMIAPEERERFEQTFPRFIAATKDCSCLISFAPQSADVNAKGQSAILVSSLRNGASSCRDSVITSVGGRSGVGTELICQQPYPIVSVTRVFSFETDGYVCTLLVVASDANEKPAVQMVARHLAEIDAIARSITIRKPDATAAAKRN